MKRVKRLAFKACPFSCLSSTNQSLAKQFTHTSDTVHIMISHTKGMGTVTPKTSIMEKEQRNQYKNSTRVNVAQKFGK